jgi:menaquinone-specific isochorismate synthase
MTILPLHPAANASPEALRAFLEQCRVAALRDGHAKLVSISLAVDALDPLAVLESIFDPAEPHFYAERPGIETAIAGAEIATAHEARGPRRFAEVQRWIDETILHTIAVGDVGAPFGGPHFFAGFTFHDEVEEGEAFPPAFVFVPRWQVSLAGTTTTAVANLLITPNADLIALAQRVWRAHGKFRRFEYAESGAGNESGANSQSGTGVPPVDLDREIPPNPNHGRDARATPEAKSDAASDPSSIQVRQGAYLPHWIRDGAIYAVTFRLADSLPAHVVEHWATERAAIEARARKQDRPLSAHEQESLHRLHSEKVEAYLDTGAGACYLRQTEIAKLVIGALRHFDGTRYELREWCVMPNHVHAIVRPLGPHSLKEILHTWKSYTAKEANRLLHRTGEFWQPEYYDHLIRNEAEYLRTIDYISRNPEKAGLQNWPWLGSGTGVPPVVWDRGVPPNPNHGRDARATHDVPRTAISTAAPIFTTREIGDYRSAVTRALERIEAGEFKKIVLARVQDLAADQPLHPLRMLNGLRQRFPDCYSFSFAQGGGPSFIGASPERLVRVSKGMLETEALAGSIRRGASASEDASLSSALLHSEKDLREHRDVLDDIVARLTPLGIAPQHPTQPQIRRLANVQHLDTPVHATLPDGVHVLDVLAAMHPTPAVGGTPRETAVKQIRDLEGFPRGLYAGALGWLNAWGGGEFFVGIRSALVEGSRARVFAGAGIVAGSTPEKEFAETELKFKAMLDALLM